MSKIVDKSHSKKDESQQKPVVHPKQASGTGPRGHHPSQQKTEKKK